MFSFSLGGISSSFILYENGFLRALAILDAVEVCAGVDFSGED